MTKKMEDKAVAIVANESRDEITRQPKKKRCPHTGSLDEDFVQVTSLQVGQTLWLPRNQEDASDQQIMAVLAALRGVAPKAELEGMMAAQMVGLHNAAMECLRRAMIRDQASLARESNLNQANKLSRTFATTLDALQRYRGKGQQKVTVEHVQVHAGGQAIVGEVHHSRGEG